MKPKAIHFHYRPRGRDNAVCGAKSLATSDAPSVTCPKCKPEMKRLLNAAVLRDIAPLQLEEHVREALANGVEPSKLRVAFERAMREGVK